MYTYWEEELKKKQVSILQVYDTYSIVTYDSMKDIIYLYIIHIKYTLIHTHTYIYKSLNKILNAQMKMKALN